MADSVTPSNETLKLLYERASLRNFSDRPVTEDVLNQILEAGICSATGGNLQPYSVIVIRNRETMQTIVDWGNQVFIRDAPVNLLFCIDWHRTEVWCQTEGAPYTANQSFRHFWIAFQDTIIAAQNMATAADSLGMGSVYIGTIIEFIPECRDLFQLPSGVLPVVLLTMGYPEKSPAKAKKFGREVVNHHEKYQPMDAAHIEQAVAEKYGDRRAAITEDDARLKTIYEVYRNVRDAAFARKCIEETLARGFISMSQKYFALHYRADMMPARNLEFVKQIEDSGFNWFKNERSMGYCE